MAGPEVALRNGLTSVPSGTVKKASRFEDSIHWRPPCWNHLLAWVLCVQPHSKSVNIAVTDAEFRNKLPFSLEPSGVSNWAQSWLRPTSNAGGSKITAGRVMVRHGSLGERRCDQEPERSLT